MTQLETLIEGFIVHRITMNNSKDYLVHIRKKLEEFRQFLGDGEKHNPTVREMITSSAVDAYLRQRRDQVMDSTYLFKELPPINGFLEWLAYFGHIERNPIYLIPRPPVPAPVLDYPDQRTVEALELALYKIGLRHAKWPQLAAARNVLGVRLLACNGLRLGEMAKITFGDARTTGDLRLLAPGTARNTSDKPVMMMRVIGKGRNGGRVRVVPMSTPALEQFKAMLKEYPAGAVGRMTKGIRSVDEVAPAPIIPALGWGMLARGNDPFYTPLSGRQMRFNIDEAAHMIGMRIHPHMLRRYFIMQALNAGVSEPRICLCTGHTNSASLMHYISRAKVTTMVDVLEAANKGHGTNLPREEDDDDGDDDEDGSLAGWMAGGEA